MPLRSLKYSKKVQVLFIPVFVLMAIGLLIVYNVAARSLEDEHRERLMHTAHLTEEGLKTTEKEMMKLANLFQINRTLKEYLYISTVLGGNWEPLRDLLKPLAVSLEIDDLDLYDNRGKRVLHLGALGATDPKDERVSGITGAPPTEVQYGFTETSKTLRIVAVCPLRDKNSVVGYIAVGKFIDRIYLKELKEISGNELFRVDTRNMITSANGEEPVARWTAEGKLTMRGITYSVLERNLVGIYGEPLGKLVIALSDDDLNDSTGKLKLYMFAMLGVAALLSFIMSRLFIKTLVDPLKTMTVFTGKVARGELEDRLPVNGRDEIAVLAGHFNEMQKQLRTQRDVVERYTSDLEHNVKERTSELEKVQQQLLHSQKMEAIGQLSGGIAHDFNNFLTAILGYADIVRRRLKADDPLKMPVDHIITASRRATSLTHGLLAFSRKQIITPMPVDLNVIVKNVETLLARLIREDIELKTKLADHALTILADDVQLEQVLMNLVTNARDAMPDGGHLTIETTLIGTEDDFAKIPFDRKPGAYAVLTVSDTGTGMDPLTKQKIFEPFFTTKEVGKGTGLGLAMVYGIIKQHEGSINVYSEAGSGTTFRIYLPIVGIDIQAQRSERESLPPRGGSEVILLAEDDSTIRELSRSVLEDAGYSIILASDGHDAVEKFRREKDRIQLLILDVVMPKKNGRAAYEEIKKIRPDMKVLFTSGYTADILNTKGILDDGIHLIQKPMSSDDLLRKIRSVLDK